MAGHRLTKKAKVSKNNEPVQDSSRVRHTSAARPPIGPLDSHPIDEPTRHLIKTVARRESRRNRQITLTEVPLSDAPGRQDVIPQGPSYLIWNDPEARMLRAGETAGVSLLLLPPRGGSAEQQASPHSTQDDNGDKKIQRGSTDRQPTRPSSLRRHHPSQRLQRSLSSLRAKYYAVEAQNHAPLPVPLRASLPLSSHASAPRVNKAQSSPVKNGGAGGCASAQGSEADQTTQRRPSLQKRTSQRLRRTASNLGRRLSSSCASSISSGRDEPPTAGR